MYSVLIAPPTVSRDEQHRQVLRALRPQAMSVYLEEVFGSQRAGGATDGPAVCHILDVKYEPGEYCTIVYQLGERIVIGGLRWGEAHDEAPKMAQWIAPLGMWAFLFPHDPALPGLATALDPQAVAHVLAEALPECRVGATRVLRCRVTPLRYRPGKRFTLRLDVWLRDTRTDTITSRVLFGKLYHNIAKAASVYREMQLLSDAAPARDGPIVLARAFGLLADLQMVLQEPVEGAPLDMLLGRMEGSATAGEPRGWRGCVRAAAALASLHTARLVAGRERPIAAELARFGRRAAQVATVDAALGTRLGELAATLPAWLGRLPEWGAETCLIHGDCKPSQFLIGAAHIALLDLDHCGMADPASDVGTFLASLRQLSIQQSLKAHGTAPASLRARWLEALEQRFLDEYCAAGDRGPGFRLRATWYEAVALLRKALRGFARSPGSPLPAALIEEAWHCLAALPPHDC